MAYAVFFHMAWVEPSILEREQNLNIHQKHLAGVSDKVASIFSPLKSLRLRARAELSPSGVEVLYPGQSTMGSWCGESKRVESGHRGWIPARRGWSLVSRVESCGKKWHMKNVHKM